MDLLKEVLEMKKEVEAVKNDSLAMELLKDSKSANKRIAIAFASVLVFTILIYFVTVGLFLKYISDIGEEETIVTTKTQEIDDIGSIENTNIVNGDMYGESKTN